MISTSSDSRSWNHRARLVCAIGFLNALILSACSSERPHAAQATHPPKPGVGITEVTFARSLCNGWCPGYQVTFQKDGCAIYDGYGYVPWVGHYYRSGSYPNDFFRIANLIDDRGFFAMQRRHGNWILTDAGYSLLSVVKNGVRKSVRVAEVTQDAEPMGFYELGQVIDGIIFKTLWFGKGGKPPYGGLAPQRPPTGCSWSRKGPEPFAHWSSADEL